MLVFFSRGFTSSGVLLRLENKEGTVCSGQLTEDKCLSQKTLNPGLVYYQAHKEPLYSNNCPFNPLFCLVVKSTLCPEGLAAGRDEVDPVLKVLWELWALNLQGAKL